MTARIEEGSGELRTRLGVPLLFMLAGFVAKLGVTVDTWLDVMPFRDLRVGPTLAVYAVSLAMMVLVWMLSRRPPTRSVIIALVALLLMLAIQRFTGAAAIPKTLAAQGLSWSQWAWGSWAIFGIDLFIGASAIWGLLRLAPLRRLKDQDEPLSPATRRTRNLFGLSGLLAVFAVLVLMLGVRGDGANPVWSNSQNLPVGIAIAAIFVWLVAMALSWWWYASADEHERRANDVGFLAGGGLFMAATPVWWILSRAGLVPPPDAMILWYATMVATGIGWAWYRNR